jgi:pterin-4a-carbinolamine dehydratase
MNEQTAVEQQTTQDPAAHPGGDEPAGGTLPGPEPRGGAVQRLKSERVEEELQAMSGWALAREEKAIECVKTFPTSEVAALYAAFVSRFASAAGFFVTVSLAGGQVCLTVFPPQSNGCRGEVVDLPVLAFARQL